MSNFGYKKFIKNCKKKEIYKIVDNLALYMPLNLENDNYSKRKSNVLNFHQEIGNFFYDFSTIPELWFVTHKNRRKQNPKIIYFECPKLVPMPIHSEFIGIRTQIKWFLCSHCLYYYLRRTDRTLFLILIKSTIL